MARRRYTEAEKRAALAAVATGRGPTEVATSLGIPIATLRRWLKAAGVATAAGAARHQDRPRRSSRRPTAPAPHPVRLQLVVIDAAGDLPKIQRILHNEGLALDLVPLDQHAFAESVADGPAWRGQTWVADVDDAAAQRIFDLIERSGKVLPLVVVGTVGQRRALARRYYPTLDAQAIDDLGVVLDRERQHITQHAALQAQLRDCRTHFEQLLRCSHRAFDADPVPFAIVGALIDDVGHRYANDAYLALVGATNFEDIQGLPFTRLLDAESGTAFIAALGRLDDAGATRRLELCLRRGDAISLDITRFPGTSCGFQIVLQTTATLAALSEDREQALWAERINAALTHKGLFSVVYQPIVALCGVSSDSYEVLLRLHGGDGEYLPAHFIPAAERSGLMVPIDRRVIGHAVEVIREERHHGKMLTLFVNLSRGSVVDPEFPAWLRATLSAAGIPAGALVLEISCRDITPLRADMAAALSAIRAIGCRIALDHAGTACLETGIFHQVTMDFIKLDRSLTAGNAHPEATIEAIGAMIGAAETAGAKTIAGFVQDAESVSRLWRCGVTHVQGYFLQQPSRALNYEFTTAEYEIPSTSRFGL
ncbi:MAG: EAL domain-containing protein [Gammaproteobacteria bacterium]|nr:EAL domain-containing protein [Gammaproteobacteria bacterium]